VLENNDFDFAELYAAFEAPIATLDCGQKCAPYNEHGIPFGCDARHAVPAVYADEWRYLQMHTDLWHLWEGEDPEQTAALRAETPPGMELAVCQGYHCCQRDYRSVACRAFPFFPYFTSRGEFIGLSYYWEFEDRCWVISHLDVVTSAYRQQFSVAYEKLFKAFPQERETYAHHSALMRKVFLQRRRAIPLLHRNGKAYKISPRSERMRRVDAASFLKHGVYRIAADLSFPDER